MSCVECSPWEDTDSVEQLSGPEVFSQLVSEFSEGRLSTLCGRLQFLGGQPLCLDPDLLPRTGACLVYSVTLNTSLTLETDMPVRFGCEVHLFNPTMAQLTPPQLPKNVSHHRIGISDRARQHRAAYGRRTALVTLDELTSVLGHQGRDIHYLKLDVAGGEWDTLQQQVTSRAATLHRVSQLYVAFHLALPQGTLSGDPAWQNQLAEGDARRFLRTLLSLKAAGFRLAHTDSMGAFPDHPDVAKVYETLWIRWDDVRCGVNMTRGGVKCCGYGGVECEMVNRLKA